eukprot:GHVU01010453.1.p1 GENE.GHVU01010453.1~~GHVU01010453.1.p1  ORF type:complete len:263 (+),score=33.79 GHVU01010453.1:144-932(+)
MELDDFWFDNDDAESKEDHKDSIVEVQHESVIEQQPVLTTQNVIASVSLCQNLDLRNIAISARNAEYNPKKVKAVVMRLREPKCTGLIFQNGKVMVTGASDEEQAKLGGKRMARICQKAGHKHIQFRGFQVENMIARTDCRFPIRLEGLALDHKDYVTFGEHLSFPGLIYRYHKQLKDSRNELGVPSDKAVLLIFNTGKIIITGCKSGEEANAVFSEMFPVLLQYRLMPGEKVSDKVVNSDGQTTGCAPTTGNAKPSASSSV